MLAGYRMPRWYRIQILVVFPVLAAFAIPLVIGTVRSSCGFPLAFALIWLAALGWNAYWFLFRLCYRIDLHQNALHWWTPLRHGQLALSSLRAVRPGRLSGQLAIFEAADGPTVVTLARPGFVEFAAAVQAAAPYASVSTSWYARIVGRLPGRSGFRAGDGSDDVR
jgi:hypothetical protein